MAHWHAKLVGFGFRYCKLLFGDGLVASQSGVVLVCSISGTSSLRSALGWGSSVCSWTSWPFESVVQISLDEFPPLEKTLRLGTGSAGGVDSPATEVGEGSPYTLDADASGAGSS